MTQKEIMSNATQQVASEKTEAEALKILMENDVSYNTLDNLLKIAEFEPTVTGIIDRTDTDDYNVIFEFARDTDSEGILDGFDYEVYGGQFFITEKVVAHV